MLDMLRRSRCVVMLLVAAGATHSWAQGQPRDPQPGRDGQRAREGMGDRRPRDFAGDALRGAGGMMERPEITRRDVDSLAQTLGFNEDQLEASGALWEGYSQEVRALREEARAAREKTFESFRDGGGFDPDAFRKLADDQIAMRAKRRQLDDALMNDLRSLLTPEQQPAWEGAARVVRRQQSLRMGVLSGERVDIARLVSESDLDENARRTVAPLLEQYSLDLDRELAARDAVLGDDFGPGFMRDPEQREQLLGKLEQRRAASEKVRDVNERYARQVALVLPEDKRAAFESAYRRAKFPQVYRITSTQEALDAVARFDDLTTEQRESLTALRERYSTRLQAIQPRHERALMDLEKNFDIQQVFRRGERDLEGDAMRTIREERRELEDATTRELRAILNAEQLDRLPEPEQREFRRGRGGRGGGGGGMTDGF